MLDKCPFSYSPKKGLREKWKWKRCSSSYPPRPFLSVYNLLHFSISSPYSSRWRRTMFSTKLERLLPLSAQSAHDEVRPLLCLPAQIDRLSAYQFGWNKIGLLVGFKRFLSHLGADASLNGCVLCVLWWHCILWWYNMLLMIRVLRWNTRLVYRCSFFLLPDLFPFRDNVCLFCSVVFEEVSSSLPPR